MEQPTQVLGTGPTASEPGAAKGVSWWQRPWAIAVFVLAALLVGIGIGAGSKKAKAAPSAAAIVATERVRKEHLHEERAQHARERHEQVVREKREASERAATRRHEAAQHEREAEVRRKEEAHEREEAARKKAEETKTFSGTGGQSLGTIDVPVDSTLRWECPPCSGGESGGDNFSISNNPSDEHQLFVNTLDRSSGETQVDEGTYHDVTVNTEGEEWTIHITPNE